MGQSILQALDQAICEAGWQRLGELVEQIEAESRHEAVAKQAVAEQINGSLFELANLANRMPNYNNDWLALFYALWYQPKQINVAYRAIDRVRAYRHLDAGALIDGRRLRIVDFGCGSLAMLFGTALALADALERGEEIEAVQVDCIDNEQMIWIGALILEQFQQTVVKSEELEPLTRALQLINWKVGDIQQINQPIQSEEKHEIWFSALHIVYSENIPDIVPVIRSGLDLGAAIGFFSSFSAKKELVRRASLPFEQQNYVLNEPICYGGLNGWLRCTTSFRRQIARYFSPNLSPTAYSFLAGTRSAVDCEPQATYYRAYTKR